jgi:hypothetical protein
MFQGLSVVFLYVLFCGLGLAFLGFFITVFRILLCHRRPLSFSDVRDDRSRKNTEMSEAGGSHDGDRELSSTRNVLQEVKADIQVERNVEKKEEEEESTHNHTSV